MSGFANFWSRLGTGARKGLAAPGRTYSNRPGHFTRRKTPIPANHTSHFVKT